MIKRTIVTVLIGAILQVSTFSANSGVGYTADFLNLGTSARNYAMGNSDGADYGDIWSAIINPAGIPNNSEVLFSVIQQKLFEDTSYNTYGLSFPLFEVDCAIQYHNLNTTGLNNNYLDTNGKPVLGSSFSSSSEAFILSLAKTYSYDNNFKWILGVNAKAMQETILDSKGQGIGGDIGIILKVANIQLGYSVINCVQPEMVWNTSANTKEKISELRIGAIQYNSEDKSFKLAMSLHQAPNSNTSIFHVGCSYSLFDILELRAGMNDGNPSYGLGLKIGGLSVDYGTQININDAQNQSNSKLTLLIIL